jgi:hypothetical protein
VATCPACGIEVAVPGGECPRCHLSSELFEPVREAAQGTADQDPAYLRTIGELLATVELERPAAPGPVTGLLSRPGSSAPLSEVDPVPLPVPRPVSPVEPIVDLPAMPAPTTALPELERRIREYLQVGRRLQLDFTDFETRAHSAALATDVDSLEVLAREMFVHLSSTVVEEYESLLAVRNELAQMLPTSSADVELAAVRRAIRVGDFPGAVRRLQLVRDELGEVEQQWQVGRILVTEGELMSATIRELGGDPTPAAGPLEQGRRLFAEGHRAESERVLARAAIALWTLLQPLLMADLRRLRDRMIEVRATGLDIEPAVRELRAVSVELRHRNFVGTVVAFRRLRAFVDRTGPPPGAPEGPEPPVGELRSAPPA